MQLADERSWPEATRFAKAVIALSWLGGIIWALRNTRLRDLSGVRKVLLFLGKLVLATWISGAIVGLMFASFVGFMSWFFVLPGRGN